MLYEKYEKNWPHGFKGDVVYNVERRTDDGRTDGRVADTFIYYKLTNEPSAQVSYKVQKLTPKQPRKNKIGVNP